MGLTTNPSVLFYWDVFIFISDCILDKTRYDQISVTILETPFCVTVLDFSKERRTENQALKKQKFVHSLYKIFNEKFWYISFVASV